MAIPRVFISSTCYDLANERDSLITFCQSFGFEVVLSERGDIFFHPDLHTHTSCIHEVSSCHLFILIVGGRFGGKYVIDKNKSITNAEYNAARESGLPIFTFVKLDVLNDHNIWQKNKDQDFAKQIKYPSIENLHYSTDIFSFIDQVRLAPTNNGLFSFTLIKELHDILRKQWGSMFFELLQNRKMSRQSASTNDALITLSAASLKIEELVKSLYQNIDRKSADAAIPIIALNSRAKELFLIVENKIQDKEFLVDLELEDLVNHPPGLWYEFFVQGGFFDIKDGNDIATSGNKLLVYHVGSNPVVSKVAGKMTKSEQIEFDFFQECYDAYLNLTPDTRRKIIEKYVWYDPDDLYQAKKK
jgi:hypothetical protein